MSDDQARRSPYLTVDEVAARLRLSTRTVHELARNREIPHRRLPGAKRLLFVESELEAWEHGSDLEVIEPARGGRVVRPIGARPVRPRPESRMAATILAA